MNTESSNINQDSETKVSISHCSDQGFLEEFREDMSSSTESVTIMSPFLSPNRALHYYPVMMTLFQRQVPVTVYAKPKNEQPESLRAEYHTVQNGLERVGVTFLVRPLMHEKVGVIDGRVLWHGSLNILSHNDTRESMLRIESKEVVQEVLTDLGLDPGLQTTSSPDEATDQKDSKCCPPIPMERPDCPECGSQMILYERSNSWICPESPRCPGALPFDTISLTVEPQSDGTGEIVGLDCPICQAHMAVQRGIVLRIGCTAEECGFALDPRLSAGILRVLRKRAVR